MFYQTIFLVISLIVLNLGLLSTTKIDSKDAENKYYEDIRSLVKEITGDADNLDKLVNQLKEIRRDRRSTKYTLMDPGK